MITSWRLLPLTVAVASILAANTSYAQHKSQILRGVCLMNAGNQLISAVMLLGNEPVRQELALSDLQVKAALVAAMDLRTMIESLALLPPPQRQQQRLIQELRRRAESPALAPAIELRPPQRERLGQILIQVNGGGALSRPEVADQLALTTEQRDAVAKLADEHHGRFTNLERQAGDSEFGKRHTRQLRDLLQQRSDKLLGVLTEEQRQKLKELRGQPFDLDRLWGGFGG